MEHTARNREDVAITARTAEPRPAYNPRLLKPAILLPGVVLALGTAVFLLTPADLVISAAFYDASAGVWPLFSAPLFRFLFDYGQVPGIVIGAVGLGVAAAGNVSRYLYGCRYSGLFLAAVLLLGPGLLVNGTLKPLWGRPRPVQCAAFGGGQAFTPVGTFGDWNVREMHKSFPCGHASIGFFLAVPAFLVWRKRHTRTAVVLFACGTGYGLLMGLARVAQGRHFASDVLWSAAIVYFTALALYPLLRWDESAVAKRAATREEAGSDRAVLPFTREAERTSPAEAA
jgi:lipid A 4'-phosphatase